MYLITPSNKTAAKPQFAVKALSAVLLSAFALTSASAAGLGQIKVLSALGQPLKAEIELNSVTTEEFGTLVAKLASAETFRQANIDFNAALLSLRFQVVTNPERQFIAVSSTQPVNEPFVDLLLELHGPNGRLVREYTFLLDPAELQGTQLASVSPEAVARAGVAGSQASTEVTQPPASRPTAPATGPANAQTVAKPQTRESAAPAPAPSQESAKSAPQQDAYEVKVGDTLTRIAKANQPAGVSLDQMLVALYQNNPGAFMGENMNRMQAGRILKLPSAAEVANVDRTAAREVIVAQALDFNAYRQRLAAQVESAAASPSAESGRSSSGQITTRVEERAASTSATGDKLELSRGGMEAGTASARLEDNIAGQKALAEEQARARELEENVKGLEALLELKSAGMAELQNAQEGQSADSTTAAVTEPESQIHANSAGSAAPVNPAPVEEVKPNQPTIAAPVVPVEQSLLDDVLANPLLPATGILILALGALGIYRIRRQRKSKQFEDSVIAETNLKANSLFGATGGQSVDTNNSVFNSSFAPSVSNLDSNEVDPVAEADVYIAYGRDAQAEEILNEALKTQPERHAVRVKLLEIFSNRKDLQAFAAMAAELYEQTKGEGEDWEQAVEMGLALDPNNQLYAGAKEAPAEVSSSAFDENGAAATEEQGLETLLSESQGDTIDLSGLEVDTAYFEEAEADADVTNEQSVTPQEAKAGVELTENTIEFESSTIEAAESLDFSIEAASPTAESEPSPVLDFDFLDGDKSPAATLQLEGAEIEGVEEEADVSVAEVDSIASALDALELALNEMSAQAPTLDSIEPMSLSDFKLDVGSDAEGEAASIEEDAASLSAASDVPVSEGASMASPNPLDFDLSDISLELDPSNDLEEPLTLSVEGGDAFIESEMATKLDLAIAYQEIGDKEGARELLDEVLKGGSPEQSERAKSLLLELA